MKLFICLISLAVALAAPSPRVTNGRDAEEGEFPYQVSLQWGIFGIFQHICGGSIIAENWILTAGHCITEIPFKGSMKIKAGITELSDKGDYQVINVIERIVHPDYKGGVNPNDIALLKLESNLVFNDKVQPIKVPKAGSIATGKAVLSGWGSTSLNMIPSMPNHLQTAVLDLLTFEECKNDFVALAGTSDPLAESNVCTGPVNEKLSACSGDSGGPLAKDGEIIGVVSWGMMPCGTKGAPSVFTQVSSFTDFINEHVQ